MGVNYWVTKILAVLRHFCQFWPVSYVKPYYFTSVKKRHLQPSSDNLKKTFPGANPRRGQERKEARSARLGSPATGSLCLLQGAFDEGGADQCRRVGRTRHLNCRRRRLLRRSRRRGNLSVPVFAATLAHVPLTAG